MRVLLLTASTGGGHDMRASAFQRWAEKLTNWDTRIHRPLERSHGSYRFGVETYNWIQRNAPFLHHGYFNLLELVALHRNPALLMGAHRFVSVIEEFRPDVVVSTHAHLNHGYFALARRHLGHDRVRCVTYCGEFGGGYGFSRHWVNPLADGFIGAVEETVQAATERGIPVEKAWAGGFLLFPDFFDGGFTEEHRRQYVRDELDLDPDHFILLLATGAVGANNHLSILRELERRAKPIQVVALCGKNARTFESVQRSAGFASAVKVKALRYRDDMPLLLRSVSALVARPGTGTTSEAILTGCPLIMNGIGSVMPQESITARYASRYGFALSIRRPRDVGVLLDSWEHRPDELEAIKTKMTARRPECHPRDILERATGIRLTDAE